MRILGDAEPPRWGERAVQGHVELGVGGLRAVRGGKVRSDLFRMVEAVHQRAQGEAKGSNLQARFEADAAEAGVVAQQGKLCEEEVGKMDHDQQDAERGAPGVGPGVVRQGDQGRVVLEERVLNKGDSRREAKESEEAGNDPAGQRPQAQGARAGAVRVAVDVGSQRRGPSRRVRALPPSRTVSHGRQLEPQRAKGAMMSSSTTSAAGAPLASSSGLPAFIRSTSRIMNPETPKMSPLTTNWKTSAAVVMASCFVSNKSRP
ncbi:hypothetical protein DFJ74DRAFT_665383 [Hyaloraphidium curvatum]|nr:hypothetical protein DFJ74DRAFT_665383 [Hyaloraphidium curvatum]